MANHTERAGELTKHISKDAIKRRVQKRLSSFLAELEATAARFSDRQNNWRDDGTDGVPLVDAESLAKQEAVRLAALGDLPIFAVVDYDEPMEFSILELLHGRRTGPRPHGEIPLQMERNVFFIHAEEFRFEKIRICGIANLGVVELSRAGAAVIRVAGDGRDTHPREIKGARALLKLQLVDCLDAVRGIHKLLKTREVTCSG